MTAYNVPAAYHQGLAVLRALRAERMSYLQVQHAQTVALRAMVRHAYRNSPFYRAKFQAAGLTADDIRSVTDLVRLPATTKQEIRAAGSDAVVARGFDHKNTITEPTSGSSGTVLDTVHSLSAYHSYTGFAFRHLSAIGYRPWHRVAYTSYDPLPPLPWHRIGLGRREHIDLTRTNPRSYVEDLLRIRPQIITAYPSILQLIIRATPPNILRQIRPTVIHLHSELLTDSLREQIGKAFDCDCFDDYSTCEFHHVAYECPRHRYHLAADNVVIEFVRDGLPVEHGDQGEILLTGLTNRAMPLLRYAIGDIGAAGLSQCPCGRGFPTLQLIEGRVDDFITMPSGRTFSPRMINPAYENLPGVLEHVLVQESLDRIVVHLHVADLHQDSTPPLIVAALQRLFGEPITIDVRLNPSLTRGRTGKLRTVASRVPNSLARSAESAGS